jgi:hypothetical protein
MIDYKSDSDLTEGQANPIMTTYQACGGEELLVHDWRVDRLARLGLPGSLAEVYADRLDWHQVARLVQHGCPPRLALRIVL